MKIILDIKTNEVLAVKDDNFTLASTDTDVSIMYWSGDIPEIGSVYKDDAFVTKWQAESDEDKLNKIRTMRDLRLAETDYAAIRHRDQQSMGIPTTITDIEFNQLMAYRQALRDITATADLTADSIDNIGWPTKPNFV